MKTISILRFGVLLVIFCTPTFANSIAAWGYDYWSQVSDTPTETDFVDITGGGGHSLALKSEGSVAAWGWDEYGQVTNTPSGNNFTNIACGDRHSLALKSDGSVVSWGNDDWSQVSENPANSGFVDIAAGWCHSLALKSDGSIVCWGYDYYGLGNVPSGNDFVGIAGGATHSIALRANSSIVSWGNDDYGQISDTPTAGNFIAIAAGTNHSLALKSDGSIIAWGSDEYGQVSNTPTGGEFIAIAAGYRHNLALRADGSLVSWGYDYFDQVSNTPGGSGFTDIAAGGFHSLALIPEPALAVKIDIKPRSCPNPVNVKSSGVLPVAILGTEDVNVIDIVIASIRLADPNVAPIRNNYEDVAAPVFDANDCNCTTDGPDGFLDLTLKFETQRIVEAIGDVNHGDILTLMLTGVLFDETPIEGADCILIRGRHKPINPADINKDGVVDTVDFAIFAQNWLQSSNIED